jgi:hypothetical protein
MVIASCTLVERTCSESTTSGFGGNSCDVDLRAHCSTTVQKGTGRRATKPAEWMVNTGAAFVMPATRDPN